jgi:hypothetical protein
MDQIIRNKRNGYTVFVDAQPAAPKPGSTLPFATPVSRALYGFVHPLLGDDGIAKIMEWHRYLGDGREVGSAVKQFAAYAATLTPEDLQAMSGDLGCDLAAGAVAYIKREVNAPRAEILIPHVESFCAFVFGARATEPMNGETARRTFQSGAESTTASAARPVRVARRKTARVSRSAADSPYVAN